MQFKKIYERKIVSKTTLSMAIGVGSTNSANTATQTLSEGLWQGKQEGCCGAIGPGFGRARAAVASNGISATGDARSRFVHSNFVDILHPLHGFKLA